MKGGKATEGDIRKEVYNIKGSFRALLRGKRGQGNIRPTRKSGNQVAERRRKKGENHSKKQHETLKHQEGTLRDRKKAKTNPQILRVQRKKGVEAEI